MEMIPIKSSNISHAAYENGVMRVRFSNGTDYDYDGISAELFNDFMEAESQGKFFHQHIKGKFAGTKVEVETDDG
jgi:hypothetical protein